MAKFPLQCGCLCGGARYTMKGSAEYIVHCHYSECRRGNHFPRPTVVEASI